MNPPKPVEWAKVVRRFKTIADVFIGDVRVHAVHSGDYATNDSEVCMEAAKRMADDINRALSPLLARAELLDRAVFALASMRDAVKQVPEMNNRKYDRLGVTVNEILTSYASLPKMPEQGKSEEEKK